MSAELLTYTNEQLEASNPLAQLEEIIEATAAKLSPAELAILEAPNPTPSALQIEGAETMTTQETFDGVLQQTPEVETPPHDHTMKVCIRKETSWAYKM